jgi:hypothetical protein
MSNNAPNPPALGTPLLINDGTGAFADQVNNVYFISYSSIHHPDDNIGNQSYDGINWFPAANNTDPPSHFVVTVKDFPTDCNFYPVFDLFNGNLFAMAWLESNLVGRLNLKYTDIPVANNLPTTTVTPASAINNKPVNNQQIYIYPNTINSYSNVQTQNIPMSDIYIVDLSGNQFHLDAFMPNPNNRGYALTMPDKIKAIRFSQTFREKITLLAYIGTAITINNTFSLPLSNVALTIYYSNTQRIYQRLNTDVNGKYTVVMQPGTYVFELEINSLSINYTQKFV